tara:strand:+ start:333 stop:881 length:549 start_codon:yes stop_codon:yes gene_type:complete
MPQPITWCGCPVSIINSQAENEPLPEDVASSLEHLLRLDDKIVRLSEARQATLAALTVSTARWAPSPHVASAIEMVNVLKDRDIRGRSRIRQIVNPNMNAATAIRHCVYALISVSDVVYVGRSEGHQSHRVNKHHKSGKVFDEVILYRCRDAAHMKDLEAVLIDQHRPYYNRKAEPRVGFGS